MSDTIKVTDETTRDELASALEIRCRRLMAERAALPSTWMSRARRAELTVEIDETLEEFNATK